MGCKEDDDFSPQGEFGFIEGVASFDPDQNGIILWSRYTPATNELNSPEIILDVALDDSFSSTALKASENVAVDSANDYTIHVDVQNLEPNTTYYYRFRNDKTGATSVTGQTKTLPAEGQINSIKSAVVSCANFQAGLFNVYGAIAASDADVVIHLGDYIYEYGVGGYGSNAATDLLLRNHKPEGEIISLDDYRERYRQYRSDKQLQEAHRLKPFICVWDDHEITNDAYRDGAQNHQEDEGDFETRKLNALQAWHEYLPARVDEQARIYRNFNLGGIANLMMLDTRIIGRDKQLDYSNYLTADGLDAFSFATDWLDTNRTILGMEQRDWLTSQIASNTSTWQVIGSQVLMGKYMIPVELLTLTAQFASGDSSPELLLQYQELLTELTQIKVRILTGDTTVTDQERARVETVLPYNLDAWDGYPAERELILASAANKKLISLAGDTHNAWHSLLTDNSGTKVGIELATASVTSPGLEALFGTDQSVIQGFQEANQLLIDDLQYVDISQRGYLMVEYTEDEIRADWHFVNGLVEEDISTTIGNTAIEV